MMIRGNAFDSYHHEAALICSRGNTFLKSFEGSGTTIPGLFWSRTRHTTRDMCMTRNSYCCDVNDIPIALQEESLEVQNKSSAKDIFKESELHEFWMQMTRIYSKTSEFALSLLIFCSIFHQNKTRNKLSVEVDLH